MAELAIATNANQQSKAASEEILATQSHYGTVLASDRANKAYAKVAGLVPKARSQAVKAKMYAMVAAQHENHAEKVLHEVRRIPEVAAEASKKALLGWIESDARKSAEASAVSSTQATGRKIDKIANAVAAAAEPYHMALLRNQKFAAEAYSKAMSAQQSSQSLQSKATQLALSAQQLQAAGDGLDAREMYATASSMMDQAENMRQWSTKLYDEANAADTNTASYSSSYHQAAANAAGTQIVNTPMKLP
jgi:hypothetical protein